MSYWIFQANPQEFFIVHYYLHKRIATYPNEIDWWASHNHPISVGDTIFIWKSAREPRRQEAPQYFKYTGTLWERQKERLGSGIYALAEVVEPAKETSLRAEARAYPEFNIMEWHVQPKDEEKRKEVMKKINDSTIHVGIKYVHNYVTDPLLEKVELWKNYKVDDGCTKGLEKLRKNMSMRRRSVFDPVDDKAVDILLKMLKSHTPYSVSTRQLK